VLLLIAAKATEEHSQVPASSHLHLSYNSPTLGSNSGAAAVLLTIAAETFKEHHRKPARSHLAWLLSHVTWLLRHLAWLLSQITCHLTWLLSLACYPNFNPSPNPSATMVHLLPAMDS